MHPDTLKVLNSLTILYFSQGQLDHLERLHRRVWQVREKTLGKTHPQVLDAMMDLASVLKRQGKLEEAQEIRHRVAGPQSKEAQLKSEARRAKILARRLPNMNMKSETDETSKPLTTTSAPPPPPPPTTSHNQSFSDQFRRRRARKKRAEAHQE